MSITWFYRTSVVPLFRRPVPPSRRSVPPSRRPVPTRTRPDISPDATPDSTPDATPDITKGLHSEVIRRTYSTRTFTGKPREVPSGTGGRNPLVGVYGGRQGGSPTESTSTSGMGPGRHPPYLRVGKGGWTSLRLSGVSGPEGPPRLRPGPT